MVEAFDDSGNPIEGVLSPEEVEEKITEAKEEAKTAFETEKTELKTKIEKLDEELETEKGKDKNFGKLRDKKDEAETKLTELEKKFEDKFGNLAKQIDENKLDEKIKVVAGGDDKLADKIKYYFNSFAGVPEKPEDFDKRMADSLKLAKGESSGTPGNVIATGGDGVVKSESRGKVSEGASDVGKNLGLSDKEMKDSGLI